VEGGRPVADYNERLQRILTMVPYIQQNPGVRVKELARYIGCSPDTILTDLNTVLLCGVPPYLPNDYIGVVVENECIHLSFAGHFKRPVNLTFQEALSLMLALQQLPLTRQGRETSQSLQEKILKILPQGTRKGLSAARRRLDVGPLHRGVQQRVEVLRQAIEERREIHMEYYTASRDELTERDFRPYGIIDHNGEWYVVGHCLLRDAERPFRVDRIREIALLDQTFDLPKSFNLEKYRTAKMYFPTRRDLRVKLKVAPELAQWIREEQPAGKVRELADGSLIMLLSVSQPEWIVSWVMAHADQVELLAPEALRSRITKACDEALARY
jgi:proteasome accessory factor C